MATPPSAEQIGRVLDGRYRLVAAIGTGASAHVYVADDLRFTRRVAVKVLRPELAEDQSFLRKFRAEAEMVASLSHPNIMKVYDWGEAPDGPFLVLEHLGGGSLRDLLDAGHRLTVSQALVVGLQASRGLEYANRRHDLVHRDIKPANLLFDDEGRLAIADFGLARALAEASRTEALGGVLGTAKYTSPEQVRGLPLDGRSDVFSLALTLIESVTGSVPFAADTVIGTLTGRVERSLEVPPEMGSLVPVLTAAGARDRSDRLDAGAFARALDAAASDLPRPATLPLVTPPTRPLEPNATGPDDVTVIAGGGASGRRADPTTIFDQVRDAEDVGPEGAIPSPARPPTPPRPRRRWTKVLAGLVVLLALGAVGIAIAAATKPSFAVTDLRGQTLADARRQVATEEEFRVVEQAGDFFDETVPRGVILEQTPLPDESLRQGGRIEVRLSDGPAPRAVPDLEGKTRVEAQRLLEEQRLVLQARDEFDEAVPKDTVIDWSPRDTRIPRDATVAVRFSKGPEPKEVPGFLDKLYDEYQKALEALGFKPKREEAFSDKVEAGRVISVSPALAVPGSEVTVVVSRGPEKVAVPNLNGLSEDAAAARLAAVGLRLGDRFGPPGKAVFSSSPTAGAKADKGATVDVYTR